jgi:hypothetical protein
MIELLQGKKYFNERSFNGFLEISYSYYSYTYTHESPRMDRS